MYVESYTSDGFYYPEYKKIKMGKRIMPYQFKGGNNMNLEEIKFMGKGCNFPHLAYMYLQFISYSDEKTRDKYRKVYVEYKKEYLDDTSLNILTIASMCRKIKVGNKTAVKNIEFLKEHNFLSEEKFEDKYGYYHKLYSLDTEVYTYVAFDFDNRDLICGMASLRNKLIQLLIFYKFNSYAKGYYHGNYVDISKAMGVSQQMLSLYNEALVKMKLIRIEKVLLSNNKYSNRYYVLV